MKPPVPAWLARGLAAAVSAAAFLAASPGLGGGSMDWARLWPWGLSLALAGLLVLWRQSRPYRQGALFMQDWEGAFRLFGWLSAAAAGQQCHDGLQRTLAAALYSSVLETLAEPVAAFCALALVLGLGGVLHWLPRWLDGQRLAGRLATVPVWEVLSLGGAWAAVGLLLTAYGWSSDNPPPPGPVSIEDASRLLLAGLAATAAYGIFRLGLASPVGWTVIERLRRRDPS